MPTHPKGEIRNSSLIDVGWVVLNAGVGLIDSRIGVIASDTRIDGITNKTNPDGSASNSKYCATTIPNVCTII